MRRYQFEIGDFARYRSHRVIGKVVEIIERWFDYMPGNETATPFYRAKDVLTEAESVYWQENLSGLSDMEALAWALK